MNFQDVYYRFPEAAYFIFLTLLLGWLFWDLYLYRHSQVSRFASKPVVETIFVPRRSRTLYATKAIAICLAWTLITVALMQPVSYGHYPSEVTNQPSQEFSVNGTRKRKAHEVIVLIDASSSMSITDGRNGKSRLDNAKEIADDIISRLKGDSVALQAFTSSVTQLSPSTVDYLFVRLMLRQLKINEGGIPGTDITTTLQEIKEAFFPTPSSLLKTLIVISDGGDTAIEAMPSNARAQAIQKLLLPLQNAAQNHLSVITIGVGSRTASPVPEMTYEGKPVYSSLNEDLLKRMAQTASGHYYFGNDYAAIDLAVNIINQMEKMQTEEIEENVLVKVGAEGDNLVHKYYYHIPLGFAILLLGIALFLHHSWERRRL